MAITYRRRISAVAAAMLLSSLSHGNASAQTSIFDSPPARDQPAMTPADQLKLKKDLTAARDRREPFANAKQPKAQPARPAKP
jgi:hypothetical protein